MLEIDVSNCSGIWYFTAWCQQFFSYIMVNASYFYWCGNLFKRSSKHWNSQFAYILKVHFYRIFLSNFFELNVLRASGCMSTDFFHLLWFLKWTRQKVPNSILFTLVRPSICFGLTVLTVFKVEVFIIWQDMYVYIY